MNRNDMTLKEMRTSRHIIVGMIVLTSAPFVYRGVAGEWPDWMLIFVGTIFMSVWMFMLKETSRDINDRVEFERQRIENNLMAAAAAKTLARPVQPPADSRPQLKLVE